MLESIGRAITESCELVFPRICLICGKRLARTYLCHACEPPEPHSLNDIRCRMCFSPLDFEESQCRLCRLLPLPCARLRFLWDYSEPNVRDVISVMKYRPSARLAALLARCMAKALPDLFETAGWDLIVPMPLSRQSLLERNFNQCITLARAIAGRSGSKLHLGALKHSGYRSVQAALPHGQRAVNVKRAFSAGSMLTGSRILLVEDVVTTGATSAAAVTTLLRAGAAEVDLIALARAPVWTEFRYDCYKEFR